MPHLTTAHGTGLEYETFGDPDDPSLLLVIGFQATLLGWDETFCQQLADQRLHVIRFDNRDIGLSSKVHAEADPDAALRALYAGTPLAEAPYSLDDLAEDCVGLLDGLGVAAAHVVGGSMGAMIAHRLSAHHPERVLSLTSLMSAPLEPVDLPPPDVLAGLMAPPATSREAAVAQAVEAARTHMGERYFDPAYAAHRFALAYDRGLYAQSAGRQLAAMAASGAASDLLRTIDIPTLVIHGTADPFFAPESGKRTADLIPGAHLMLLDGMGHDLPPQLFPLVAGAIAGHTRTASALSNREENR